MSQTMWVLYVCHRQEQGGYPSECHAAAASLAVTRYRFFWPRGDVFILPILTCCRLLTNCFVCADHQRRLFPDAAPQAALQD